MSVVKKIIPSFAPPKMHEACTSLLACLSASTCCHRYLVCTRRHRLRGRYFEVLFRPPSQSLRGPHGGGEVASLSPLTGENCPRLCTPFFSCWEHGGQLEKWGMFCGRLSVCQALSVRGYLGMCLDIFRCQGQFKVEEPAGTRM